MDASSFFLSTPILTAEGFVAELSPPLTLRDSGRRFPNRDPCSGFPRIVPQSQMLSPFTPRIDPFLRTVEHSSRKLPSPFFPFFLSYFFHTSPLSCSARHQPRPSQARKPQHAASLSAILISFFLSTDALGAVGNPSRSIASPPFGARSTSVDASAS